MDTTLAALSVQPPQIPECRERANYLDELLPGLRNPMLIIAARDVVATASALTRWHKREMTAAISEAMIQTQKNFLLSLRLQILTLFVSYERAAIEPHIFFAELSAFLELPLAVNKQLQLKFMKRSYHPASFANGAVTPTAATLSMARAGRGRCQPNRYNSLTSQNGLSVNSPPRHARTRPWRPSFGLGSRAADEVAF